MTTGLLTVLLLVQSITLPAYAQSAPTGVDPTSVAATDSPNALYSISGRVVDGSGNGVTGVTVTATSTAPKYPIVFLPGVMGTLLRNDVQSEAGCDVNRGGRIWISWDKLGAMEPLYLDDQGSGPLNNCDNIQPDGRVNIRFSIPFYPDQDVKPYELFVEEATKAGFTVLNYPGYDWRLSLTDAVAKLDAFINTSIGADGKVFLVAHSMGGLLARAYVADLARANKIAGVVTVGTPYLGAPKMAQVMVGGKPGTPIDFRLNADQVRTLVHSSPGIQQLLPTAAYVGGLRSSYYLPATGVTLDTYQKVVDYFVQHDYLSSNTLKVAETFHASLDGFDRDFHAQGRYTVLYSLATTTPSTLREKRCRFGSQELCVDVKYWSLGDGTVPLGSSDLRWLPSASRTGVGFCGYSASRQGYKEHSDLLLDIRVTTDVLHVLKGEPTENCGSANVGAASVGPASFREFAVWGEGRVQIVDAQGNFTGVDESGVMVRDLIDVTYLLTDGGVILTMPTDAAYQLVIHQTGSQPMQVVGSDYGLSPAALAAGDEEYTAQAQAVFDNVAASAGGEATIASASAPLTSLQLAIDLDADGASDETRTPDAVVNDPMAVQDTTMPTTTLKVQGPQDAKGVYTSAVTVTLSAVDDNSGVLKSYLSLDNGQSWQVYSAPVTVQPGQATAVQAYTVDMAGNQEYPPQVQALSFAGVGKLYLPVVTRGGQQAQTSETEFLQETQFLFPSPTSLTSPTAQTEFLQETRFVEAAATLAYTGTINTNGEYVIANLPAGSYEVVARRAGWNITPTKTSVTLPESATTINFTATPTGFDTAEEILIPAGNFQMGCDSLNLFESCSSDEQPLHTVYLDAYNIDKYEVTNARYQACVTDGGCTAPQYVNSSTRSPYYGDPTYANYPVSHVTWYQADAFCKWAGKRLPTEAEWEKAARGNIDTRKYPWGNAAPTCATANFYDNVLGFFCVFDTDQVGARPAGASPYGVMDMAGNVWEWVNDWYDGGYYSVSPVANPQGPATGSYRVLRGGSWGIGVVSDVRSALRGIKFPGFWNDPVSRGFRCVRSQ